MARAASSVGVLHTPSTHAPSARQHADGRVNRPVDLLLAVVAGPRTWANADARSVVERVAVGISSTAGIALLWTLWRATTLEPRYWPVEAEVGAAAVATVAIAGFAHDARSMGRRVLDRTPIWARMLFRSIGFGVVLGSFAILSSRTSVLATGTIGVAMGAEFFLAARFLGPRSPTRSDRIAPARALAHHALAATLTAVVVVGIAVRITPAYPSILAGAAWAGATGCFVVAALRRLDRFEVSRIEAARALEREAERRRRAHWIHDDVCAELRGLRMALTAQPLTQEGVMSGLDDLDHHLRLRQLDEVIAGGSVAAAEILQPFVRRLQNRGVVFTHMPRFEDAGILLPEAAAELTRRAISGLCSNALNAGATQVGVSLRSDPDWLEIAVSDDAGGFEWHDVPAARGLHALSRDLHPGGVEIARTETGSCVTARVPLREHQSDDANTDPAPA